MLSVLVPEMCHLVCVPVASTLAPCEIIERSRGTWEHKKGDHWVWARISVDFGWILGPHFESFVFHAWFQVTFVSDFEV